MFLGEVGLWKRDRIQLINADMILKKHCFWNFQLLIINRVLLCDKKQYGNMGFISEVYICRLSYNVTQRSNISLIRIGQLQTNGENTSVTRTIENFLEQLKRAVTKKNQLEYRDEPKLIAVVGIFGLSGHRCSGNKEVLSILCAPRKVTVQIETSMEEIKLLASAKIELKC